MEQKRMVRLTVQNVIDELDKIKDKSKKVFIKDYREPESLACREPYILKNQSEDPETVVNIGYILPLMGYEDYDKNAITLTVMQLIAHLKTFFDKELFVITGYDEAGYFVQSICEDLDCVIISNN